MSMNIYQKISKARIMFQESGVKPSGFNGHAKYPYYELSDILPNINKIGEKLGFICIVSFDKEKASLTIRDIESESESFAIFESPMSSAKLPNCHDVQNLGAVQTYIKRYLYQHAFEIVENDILNGEHNPNDKKADRPNATKTASKPEQRPHASKERGEAWGKVKALIESSPKKDELIQKFKDTPDSELSGFVTWVLTTP